MDVNSSLSTIQTLQAAFGVVQMLNLTAWRYPPPCSMENSTKYDFIIIGGGSAGSVLASRLSENSTVNVLLIETGGYPPIEADDLPGMSPFLPRSKYDYDCIAQNDHYSTQNLKHCAVEHTAGKMLGGTGGLQHLLYSRGFPNDYDEWAKLTRDDSWNYTNLLPYFKNIENIVDKDLRASPYYKNYYGTSGILKLKRESYPVSKKYFEAFQELGHKIENVTTRLGFSDPIFNIADGVRQSTALRYLGLAKSRPNLCLALSTTATKILIENNIAVGVQVIMNGDTYLFYANKEVVLSAGTINSPKLLMLSGIGPKGHLESMGIKVIADLPVGQNYQDHAATVVAYQMEKTALPPDATNPHTFPLPLFVGQVAIDPKQTCPDCISLSVVIEKDSSDLPVLCINMLQYSDNICQKLINANKNRTLLFVLTGLMMPKSQGRILLASTNVSDCPLIYPSMFSNRDDLMLLGKCLQDYHKVINTTYFKSVDASMVDLNLCSNTITEEEFWECNALKMSATFWHFAGTCAMGSVLDSKLQVKKVSRLSVVDASSMPRLIRGKLNAAVNVLAEHGADIILARHHIIHAKEDGRCTNMN